MAMGRTLNEGEKEAARRFAHAAAALAQEAVAAASRSGASHAPTAETLRAIERATQHARHLDELAEKGQPMGDALADAAQALDAARDALAHDAPRPWLHFVPARRTARAY